MGQGVSSAWMEGDEDVASVPADVRKQVVDSFGSELLSTLLYVTAFKVVTDLSTRVSVWMVLLLSSLLLVAILLALISLNHEHYTATTKHRGQFRVRKVLVNMLQLLKKYVMVAFAVAVSSLARQLMQTITTDVWTELFVIPAVLIVLVTAAMEITR